MTVMEVLLSILIVIISLFVCTCVMGSKVKKQSELASSPIVQNRRHSIWSSTDIWVRNSIIVSMVVLFVLVLLCIKFCGV